MTNTTSPYYPASQQLANGAQVKHAEKARLTLSATGSEGGEGQRTHIQVLANSVVASVLVLVDVFVLGKTRDGCFSPMNGGDLAMVGIVAYVHPPSFYCLSAKYCLGTTPPSPQTPSPPNWAFYRPRRRGCSPRRVCGLSRAGRTGA